MRKPRDIKLATTDEKRDKLVSEPNYQTTKRFSENLLVIEMKKKKVKMYKFWYDYFKPKHGDRAKLCYTDTDSFITNIITEDFLEDISNDVVVWHDTSNYDENDKRPLSIGKNKKVIGLFKDELGGRIIKEFCALRAKTYS